MINWSEHGPHCERRIRHADHCSCIISLVEHKFSMTWGVAGYIHETKGHETFVMEAKHNNKSPTFIQNLCKNLQCNESDDYAE